MTQSPTSNNPDVATVDNGIVTFHTSGEVKIGVQVLVEYIHKIKVEIVCSDAEYERTIEAIIKGAKTGGIGDGKIFVRNLEQVIRIRTGERGNDAI